MLYNFKKNQVIQNTIVDDLYIVCKDIAKQAKRNSRYQTVDIYAPAYIIKDIYYYLSTQDSKFKESESKELLNTRLDLILTINTNLEISLEIARNTDGKLKKSYSRLCYVYDSLFNHDVEYLSKYEDSILIFGLEDDSIYDELL